MIQDELKQLRIESGQSQAELAEKLGDGGYTKQVVSAIENGKRNIGLSILHSWAKACGYRINIQFIKLDNCDVNFLTKF